MSSAWGPSPGQRAVPRARRDGGFGTGDDGAPVLEGGGHGHEPRVVTVLPETSPCPGGEGDGTPSSRPRVALEDASICRGRPRGWQGLARRLSLLALCLLPLALTACGVYTFSGATIPAQLQTVAIPLAEDRSTGGPPGLDQLLTDALVDRFADRSRLALEPDEADADAVVRATIERFSVAPAAVTSEANAAALNRVTISVRVVVEDRVEDGELLSRSFSASEDFPPSAGLQGEADAAAAALEQIARDAFTAATSDW